jgi:hypothetical protein
VSENQENSVSLVLTRELERIERTRARAWCWGGSFSNKQKRELVVGAVTWVESMNNNKRLVL